MDANPSAAVTIHGRSAAPPPKTVHKEPSAHPLAYNRLRMVIAVFAAKHGLEPRPVSVNGAKHAVMAFAPRV